MTRIPVPDCSSSYARHVIKTKGELGPAAQVTIAPLLPLIYEELDLRGNEFVNDPDQCFHG